jgi:hypothetical protein
LEFKSFALWCFECELLDCNLIVKESYWLNNHLIQIIAYHVESMTREDGTYELVPKPEQGISEDQVNVAEDLTEAPNQSSKVVHIPDPSLTQEGKSRCITQFFKLCTYWACELGSLARLWNSIQNRPFLAEIETAWYFCHIE